MLSKQSVGIYQRFVCPARTANSIFNFCWNIIFNFIYDSCWPDQLHTMVMRGGWWLLQTLGCEICAEVQRVLQGWLHLGKRHGLVPKDNLTKCKEWLWIKFLLFGISLFILCNYLLISKEFYERSKFLCLIAWWEVIYL